MKFEITEDAIKYLKEKNAKEITISLVKSNSCCGIMSNEKSIYIGQPRENKPFKTIRFENFVFYIDVFLKFYDDLIKIYIEKFLFTKTLQVENIDGAVTKVLK